MYPIKKEGLRFRNGNLQFGLIGSSDTITKYFDLYNNDTVDVDVSISKFPSYVSSPDSSYHVKKDNVLKFPLILNSSLVNQVGYSQDTIVLEVGRDSLREIKLLVSANRKATFSSDTLQPKAVVDVLKESLGSVSKTYPKDVAFEVKNKGTSDLEILRVASPCTCLTVQDLKGHKVAPGESVKVGATVINDGRKGHSTKVFYVYTNDPKYPIIEFKLKVSFVR